jgi:tetratricopeptide (TPR) repeat protein
VKKVQKEEAEEKPKRLFEPSCGGGCSSSSCGDSSCGDSHGEAIEENFEDVFYLYLESMPDREKPLFEGLSSAFCEGYVALQQGDMELAAKRLKEAEKIDGSSPAVAYTRGLLEGMTGELEAAKKHYEKALSAAPDFSSAVFCLASILRELHKSDAAVPLLRNHLEKHPSDKEATMLLGASLLDMGKLDEAEETLTELYLSDAKTSANIGFLWAKLKEAQNDVEGAMRAYQIITNSNQNMLEALIPLGLLYISQGEPYAEAAVKVFKHCYRIDQEHGWFHLLRVAEAYAVKGWHKEARKILDEVSQELPDDPNARALFDQVNKRTQGL